jgi:hypothetical protein
VACFLIAADSPLLVAPSVTRQALHFSIAACTLPTLITGRPRRHQLPPNRTSHRRQSGLVLNRADSTVSKTFKLFQATYRSARGLIAALLVN